MDRISSKGFYITLPSIASLSVFKKNKSSHFKVDLPQHIDLEGPWEVGLCEISYPHTWFNLPSQYAYYEWRAKVKEGKSDAESKVYMQFITVHHIYVFLFPSLTF